VAREVASGLGYAHGLHATAGKPLEIVHRDVSPSNIMLLRTGGIKLLDFGIAKTASLLDDGAGQITGGALIKGKLSYLSPEQVRNEPVDARSDIFSLGVVLWECLTGKRLFFDRADYHTMNNVLERPIPPPSSQQSAVPSALDFIVLRALERVPDHRYQSAKTMAQDLDHFLVENRFTSGALPHLLDDLFGPQPSESDTLPALPAAAMGAGAPDEGETPIQMTPVLMERGLPETTASAVAAAGRSEGLLPASSPEGNRPALAGMRAFPWLAAAVATLVAFAGGTLLQRRSTGSPASGALTVSLRIESDPPGAEVRAPDGSLLGRTPTSQRVPVSRTPFSFTVTKDGFVRASHSVVPDRDVGALVTLRPLAPR
jgi:hypothetical protein